MENKFANGQDLEGLVDAVVNRVINKLTGRLNLGPTGEPFPQLPELPPGPEYTGPIIVHPKLRLDGIELTQSIQYYGTGYGAENSVPIVALKPLVVRAYPYVTPGMLEGDTLSGKTVTGELILYRGNKEVYRTGPTRPAGSRVGPAKQLDRTLWDTETTVYFSTGGLGSKLEMVSWNPTLNFVVPAWFVRAGNATAVVRLWLTSGEGGIATRSENFQVIAVNAPKIALLRVNWKNPSTNAVTSPSDADMLGLVGLATRMLPFPYFETTILGVEKTKSGDFSGLPLNADGTLNRGGCNTAWVNLLTELEVTRLFTVFFKIADIVYGVVPQMGALTPVGTDGRNTGCGWGDDGVGGCLVGDALAFAHEVGHLYGCGHIGNPKLAGYDASYPNYGGSKASIGEVGIDTALGSSPLSDPKIYKDLMSYDGPQWVSPYTYLKILGNRDKHMSATANPQRVRPLLIASFTVNRFADGSWKVDKIKAHVVEGPGNAPAPPEGKSGNWSIDLIDADNRIVASHACRNPAVLGCGCDCGSSDNDRAISLDFVEAVAWSDRVTRVQINRGDSSIETIDVGEAATMEISGPDRQESSLILHIKVSHPRQSPSLVVLFTGDDGETWQPVAIDPAEHDPLVIDIASLPGGESCRFRAVATAEFRAASADSNSFSLPRAERRLLIDAKESSCEQGRVDLTAMIDVRHHGSVAPHEIVWHSDIAGNLGHGYTLTVNLEQGRHVITATIPGGVNDRVQAAGIIIVGGKGM